ncbi:chemoreceptor glutamine deamidase CheD [Methylotenera sp.]|uniref:chemoreceptor glutamine deamidase CheD n=1 Tax=Methylotenera sp. TaxID=2051956 RepID=UPI0027229E58|nr:chemoreceptor glutamine deamidase CheD [Methylotenera sp.]MDO9204523.1 chemoreceptor glutamine deamidase CheD [Methylotenera sp.]MDO9393780.1 chemoreceptor glutamine deamidase CheD [Methylotenera sp.]MDP1523221.1 chemoreceptor glutamine deamidase CheD [Methylotenera sp.]MDP1765903.1 chemoreceptor glutamine deamidase CheD [Methylotenera sp.]MDP2071440.1 chemoreceptor glutamine deamidase CheD [Methylotenera sp.]
MSMLQEEVSTTLYFDRTFDCNAAKISPGEYYFTDKDMVIVTVLGSCVSACIRDTITGIGGMNHFMLPDSAAADKDSPVSESMRYGTYAMEVLINQLLRNGARRENLEAKIFGGGNVLKSFTTMNVGDRNAIFVRKFLKEERIRVTSEDLLDIYPRKVYYFPKTGRVLVKKLKNMHNDTLVKREEAYASKLKVSDVGGEIDLF